MPRGRQLSLFKEYAAQLTEDERYVITRAVDILERYLRKPGAALCNPEQVANYLRLNFAGQEREQFVAIWLDSQHRVLASEVLSAGTISQTSVYPREVLKHAMA